MSNPHQTQRFIYYCYHVFGFCLAGLFFSPESTQVRPGAEGQPLGLLQQVSYRQDAFPVAQPTASSTE